MINENFRLQLLHTEGVFETREKAIAYVEQQFVAKALTAEPAVAFYKGSNGEKTNAIFIIGLGNGNEVFTIDSAEILNKIEGLNGDTQEQEERLAEATNFISDIIESCGLTESFDAEGKKYVYEPDADDKIIGKSESLAEAIATLSEYVQMVFDDTDLTVKDTETVSLKYKDSKDGGKVLKANVKVSSNGTSNDKSFDDNILCVKEDGLYVAVDLSYDQTTQKLTFTTSKEGKDDVVKNEIDLGIGQHIDVEAKNSNESPIVVTVEGDEIKQVSADVKILGGENNITVKEGKLYVKPVGADDMKVSAMANNIVQLYADGLFANVDVTYSKATNTLTFSNGKTTKDINLNSTNIIQKVEYDSSTNQLVLMFALTDGTSEEIRVPMDGLIDSWDVENTGHSVTLTKTHVHPQNDQLSADVNISGDADNILQNINGLLTVRGVSDNIKHGATTVFAKLNEIDTTNADNANKIAQEISDRATAINDVLNKLEQETTARQTEDEKIEKIIENLKVEELTQTVKDFKELYNTFQTEWAADKALIEKAIEDAESVAGRVAQLEKDLAATNQDLEVTKTNLTNLGSRVDAAETNITKNATDIAANTTKINEEATRATAAESDLNTALQGEITRSTQKDVELEGLIKANETNNGKNADEIAKVKQSLNDEVARATNKETEIEGALTNEVSRAKGEETRLEGLIKTNETSVNKNADEIAAVKQSLNDEVTRAKNKETEIEGNLNTEVNRATAEEARIAGLVASNTASADKNKADIEVITESVSKLRNELDNEVGRATAEETRIEQKLDLLTDNAKKAAEQALADAKTYTDGKINDLKTASETDATTKANKALEDAKAYSDEKLGLEVERAKAAEEKNASDISDLKAKDTEIDGELAKKIENVEIKKNSASDLQYTLYVDGVPCGDVNIPQDQFLADVVYDKANKQIVFTWKLTDGSNAHAQTTVDVADFINEYNAGNGLNLSDNVFSVRLSNSTEGYLTVSEDGVKLSGIDAALDKKADKADTYTKLEVDNAVKAEEIRATAAEKGLQDAIDTVNTNADALAGRVSANEATLADVTGNESHEGSIKNALKVAKEYADGLVSAETTRATAAEAQALSDAKDYVDGKVSDLNAKDNALEGRIQANETAITIINGNQSQEGSIQKALADAKAYADGVESNANAYTDGKVAELKSNDTALEGRIKANEDAIAVINGNEAQTGSISKALADAKAYTDGEVSKLNTKDSELEKAISDEISRSTAADETHTTDIAKNATAIENEAKAREEKDTELEGKIGANKAQIDILTGVYGQEGSVANALYESKKYTDDEVGKLKSDSETALANEVTRAKAAETQALADAKEYVDGEVSKLNTKDTELETAINGKVGNVEIKQINSLKYELLVDEKHAGYIDIPQDQFLSNVSYDKVSKKLTFTFDVEKDGKVSTQVVDIEISDLVDDYTNGNGIALADHVFSVKVAESDKYIKVGVDGIYTTGIDEAIKDEADRAKGAEKDLQDAISELSSSVDTKVGELTNKDAELEGKITKALDDAKKYTDEQVSVLESEDTRIESLVTTEKERAMAAESKALADANTYTDEKVTELKSDDAELEKRIKANEDAIAVINGNEAETGSIKKSLADAKAYTDGKVAGLNTKDAELEKAINDEISRSTTADEKHTSDIATNAAAIVTEATARQTKDTELEGKITANENAIKVINGNESEPGSIKKALADAKAYTDGEVGSLNTSLSEEVSRAKEAEAQALADAKEFVNGEVEKLNAKDTALEEAINGKVGKVEIKKIDNLKYELLVDSIHAGYVDIPQDQFLSNVAYDNVSKKLTFTFDVKNEGGVVTTQTTEINISDLVDEYTAGNGVVLVGKEFSVKVAESDKYIKIGGDGIYTTGIDEAIKAEADRAAAAESKVLEDAKKYTDEKVQDINDNGDALESRIKANEDAIAIINGNSAQEGSIQKALADANKYTDNQLQDINSQLGTLKDAVKTNTDSISALTDYVDGHKNDYDSLKSAVDTINGNTAVVGSFKNYTDSKVSELNQSLEAEVSRATTAEAKALTDANKYTDEAKSELETKIGDITLTEGDGIQFVGKAITVEVDGESESYLKVTRNGVKVSGIDDAIDAAKTAAIDAADTKVSALSEKVTANENSITGLGTRVSANEAAIATINGDGEGSIKNAVINAKEEITGTINSKVAELERKDEALSQKDTELENAINGKVGSVELRKESDTEYTLYVDGVKSATTINVPKDNFLKDVNYDSGTNVIKFTLVNDATFEINIHDLVNEYTAGKGLVLKDNEFGVAISTDAETAKYLVLTEDTDAKIKLNGIDKAISDAADKVKGECTYTVGEGLVMSDNKISGYVLENEEYLKVGLNGFYTTGITDAINTAKSDAIKSATEYVDQKSETLEGSLTNLSTTLNSKIDNVKTELEGKINTAKGEAVDAAKSETATQVANAKLDLEKEIATAKTEAITAAGQAADDKITLAKTELSNSITTAKTEAINAAAQDATTKVATAKAEANQYTDGEISKLKASLEQEISNANSTAKPTEGNGITVDGTKVSVKLNDALNGEGYLKLSADGLYVSGIDAKLSDMNTKLEGEAKSREDADKAINDKIGTIHIEHVEGETGYHLYVNGANVGTIDVPKDNFLEDVDYNQNSKEITFKFKNGGSTKIDIHDLVDVYTAGNGLKSNGNEFSVNVSEDGETKKYLTVGGNGITLNGISDAIKDAKQEAISECTYKSGNGLGLSDTKQFYVQIHGNEKYLASDASGLYTTGIDTAIATEIASATNPINAKVDTLKTELEGKIDKAKDDAISAAKTETESQVTTAKSELAKDIATAKKDAVDEAKSYTDSSVNEFKTSTTQRLSSIETSIETIKTDVADTKTGLANLKNYAENDHREFDTRLTSLEGKMTTAEANIVKLSADVETLKDKLQEQAERIAKIEGALGQLIDFGIEQF